MYVCVCSAITESQLRRAVSRGVSTLEELRHELKVSNCCGACEPIVSQCLEQALDQSPVSASRACCAGA